MSCVCLHVCLNINCVIINWKTVLSVIPMPWSDIHHRLPDSQTYTPPLYFNYINIVRQCGNYKNTSASIALASYNSSLTLIPPVWLSSNDIFTKSNQSISQSSNCHTICVHNHDLAMCFHLHLGVYHIITNSNISLSLWALFHLLSWTWDRNLLKKTGATAQFSFPEFAPCPVWDNRTELLLLFPSWLITSPADIINPNFALFGVGHCW